MAFAWPVLLAAGWWSRADHGHPALASVVYLAAGHVCHQRPERSFRTAGVQWPVCGRCAGLYIAAPLGALIGFRVRRRMANRRAATLVAAAAAPALATLALELAGMPVSSFARFLSALPLGVAIAYVLLTVVDRSAMSNEVPRV
jgi:uncharacterized membrane protein